MRPTRDSIDFGKTAYFVSTGTAKRQPFFRNERWAKLMVETLAHYGGKNYDLHAFVVMHDHLHFVFSPYESLEKAVQMIKGGFSFKARRAFEWKGDIWTVGYSDHRIRDEEDWIRHIDYIRKNPREARLVMDGVDYAYMGFPSVDLPRGLKP
jgi:putative transposase